MKWNKQKEFWFQSKLNKKVSYKNGSIIAGIIAYSLIFSGSINILTNPIISIFQIIYGFFILLPLSYFQMQMSERNEV